MPIIAALEIIKTDFGRRLSQSINKQKSWLSRAEKN